MWRQSLPRVWAFGSSKMVGLLVFWHHLCPWAREVVGAKGTTRLGKGILGARPTGIFNERQTHKRSRDRHMSIGI